MALHSSARRQTKEQRATIPDCLSRPEGPLPGVTDLCRRMADARWSSVWENGGVAWGSLVGRRAGLVPLTSRAPPRRLQENYVALGRPCKVEITLGVWSQHGFITDCQFNIRRHIHEPRCLSKKPLRENKRQAITLYSWKRFLGCRNNYEMNLRISVSYKCPRLWRLTSA